MLLPGCRIGLSREEKPPRTRPRCRPCARVISSRMPLVSPWRLTPSTMPSSVQCMMFFNVIPGRGHASPRTRNPDANPAFFPDFRARSADASAPQCQRLVLRKFQPHGAIALGILAPAFAHLDEQEQVHLGL